VLIRGGAAAAAAALTLPGGRDARGATTAAEGSGSPAPAAAGRCTPCLFSKPLENRSFAQVADLAGKLGIGGVDLTCRPGGHVLPERVAEDLPRAVEAFRAAGVVVPMITTAITRADEPHAEAVVRTAAGLGIRYLKPGYLDYPDLSRIRRRLAEIRPRLADLAALCAAHGMIAGYHNHSGQRFGAPFWDLAEVLDGLPAEAIGAYFDARHAVVEGGEAGWKMGMHLLARRIVIVGVKDFRWERREGQGWRARDVPLGTGMVDHPQVFRWLSQWGFAGPVSLHVEYTDRAAAIASDADRAGLEAVGRDHATMLSLLGDAGLTAPA